jgi:dTMP kinase
VVGDRVRDLLLDPAHTGLDPRAELLLYEASRAALVADVIRPRLDAGDIVLCDRFYDSTVAYQGYGRDLDLDAIASLNAWATGDLVPDVTVLLDLDPALGLERATGGGADRLESEALAFHERVREGFLAVAAEEPERVLVVPADGTPEEVAARVTAALRGHPALRAVLH